MKIAVGSGNKVKRAGVAAAAETLFDEVSVKREAVDSGVSAMPHSEPAGITGAINRAEEALNAGNYDLGVGVESFVAEKSVGMFLSGWCVAVDTDHVIGHGSRGQIKLPDQVAERVRAGDELSTVVDDVFGTTDVGKKDGTVAVLTNGAVTRQQTVETAATYALSRFATERYGDSV